MSKRTRSTFTLLGMVGLAAVISTAAKADIEWNFGLDTPNSSTAQLFASPTSFNSNINATTNVAQQAVIATAFTLSGTTISADNFSPGPLGIRPITSPPAGNPGISPTASFLDESGLGICSTGDTCTGTNPENIEIKNTELLQIDLQALRKFTLTSLTITSVQSGEDCTIYQGNTALDPAHGKNSLATVGATTGVNCSNAKVVGLGTDVREFTTSSGLLSNNYEFLFITASSVDILVGQIAGAKIPEPGTVALFGVGLLGLGWLRRRRA